jgi:hypothetical protein
MKKLWSGARLELAHSCGKRGFTLSKRYLLAAGLIIALVVSSVAFGAVVTKVEFNGSFPKDPDASISFLVKRWNGVNHKIRWWEVRDFNINCTRSGHTEWNGEATSDAVVEHRHWRSGVVDNYFQGTFRKGNRNSADGTLELTFRGIHLGHGPENCHGGPRVFHAHASSTN